MNGLVRGPKGGGRGEDPRLNCASESMGHFTFCFVKEQKVKTNEEYAWSTSEHQVSGKKLAWKMWGEKQMTQMKVTETWQAFNRS